MHYVFTVFFGFAMIGRCFAELPLPNEADRRVMLEHFAANARFVVPEAISEEISQDTVWKESEASWQKEIAFLKTRLEAEGLAGRDDILKSKQQVYDSWKRSCSVFLGLCTEDGARLRRYKDLKSEVSGYVICMKEGRCYYLSF
jgi:hypothetical protein